MLDNKFPFWQCLANTGNGNRRCIGEQSIFLCKRLLHFDKTTKFHHLDLEENNKSVHSDCACSDILLYDWNLQVEQYHSSLQDVCISHELLVFFGYFSWILCNVFVGQCKNRGGKKKRILLSALCAGVMIIRYYAFGISKIGIENDFIVKTAFYILIMQLGYSLRRNKMFAENRNVVNAVGIMIGVVGLYGWKILEGKNAFFYNFQLGEYIFLALFVCSIYAFCMNNEKRFHGLASYKGWRGVRWIAARSWEIYLVQVPLVHHLKLMRFPISLFEMLAMIFLCTFVLGAASRYTMKFITGEVLNKASTAGR